MPLPRGVDLLPDPVRAELHPGEVPLAYELATQLAGHDGIGRDPDPRFRLGLDLDPVNGGLTVPDGWIESRIGGVNAAGAAGSMADGFSRALDEAGAHVLVTDRRVAVAGTLPDSLRFWVDRRAVVHAEAAPRPFQRGRVRFTFADGSWAMAMTGMVGTGRAKRLLTALDRTAGADSEASDSEGSGHDSDRT